MSTDAYQTGPPNWVFLVAFAAFMIWVAITFTVIDSILRALTFRITGVQLQRVLTGKWLTWSAVGPGGGGVALLYELSMWFIAVGIPLGVVLVVMYVQWTLERGG